MFVLTPQDLGIILSYRCHSGCKHCLYNCGPKWEKQAMSPAMLRQALEAVRLLPRPPQVHLSGGEPFLHFELLLHGVYVAVELGIACYVETSASWCVDEEEAVERFRLLKQAGLQAVLISCSPFHAERVPFIRTLRAIRAAHQVFDLQQVIVYLPDFLQILQRFETQQPTPLSRYQEEFGLEGAARILWGGYGVISGGRAGYRLGRFAPHHPIETFAPLNCAHELLYAPHSHFDLYGNFIPAFCGGLAIGDWRELPKILDDFQNERYPPLTAVLLERGPYGLFELAQAHCGYQPLADGYTGKCHLCVDVRRCLLKTDEFAELRPPGFYQNI